MLTSIVAEDVQRIIGTDLPWERFAGKRILVTGAAGFLPAYFVETLLGLAAKGTGPRQVVGLVRNLERAQRRFAHHGGRKDFLLCDGDLAAPLTLEGRFDYVIHGASQASPRFYFTDPMGTMMPNTVGTYHLLERAKQDGTEGFLFLSSSEVYGQLPDAIREADYGYLDPMDVRSCYAEAKRAGETLCVSAHRQYRLATFIVRLFHTYGPGVALNRGLVSSDFTEDIAAGRDIVIKSDGSARRCFCYVTDALTGMFTVLLKGSPARAYNVGNDRAEVSIKELADILVAAFPDRGIEIVMDPARVQPTYAKSLVSRNCPDVSALRALGWTDRIGIAEGFRRTVTSIEEANAAA